MGLETGSYIDDLNSAWPLGSDTKNFGDDHLRLIKAIIKNSFLGATGIVVGFGTSNPTANEDSGDGYIVGSLYVNTTSGDIFRCTDNTSTAAVWSEVGAGSGDVVGPASATNNAIALFDGTTGKLIKDSATALTTLQPKPSEGAFADGDKTKLDSIDPTSYADIGLVIALG